MKTQTTPALSGSSKRASCKKLTLQKQLQIIMRPSRQCATGPKSSGDYGSLAAPIRDEIWPARSKALPYEFTVKDEGLSDATF
jgi:hypothetical protein